MLWTRRRTLEKYRKICAFTRVESAVRRVRALAPLISDHRAKEKIREATNLMIHPLPSLNFQVPYLPHL